VRVAVFGLGYVGTVTAACLAANGHDVWGVDVDATKVLTVSAGNSPVVEPGLADLVMQGVEAGRIHATTDAVEALQRAEVTLLCVGTPSTPQGGTDLTYVGRAVAELRRALAEAEAPATGRHVVVMRSTVPPGTVESLGADLADIRRIGAALEVGVAMCPEFLREGTGISDFYSPPFTVIGASDPQVAATLGELFGFLDSPLRVVDIRTAEALKYACNAFHATKVSFTNEMGRIFRPLGIDTREVMALFCEDDHLNISSRYLRPGFAFGGSCLPKDVRSLLHIGRMESIDLPLLSGTLATNRVAVADVVDRVIAGAGRRVTLFGLSFKADSDDLRESPYVEVAETLIGKGYEVRIYDPIVNPGALVGANRAHVESRLPHLTNVLSETPSEALAGADVAIVSSRSAEVVDALLANPPAMIIDLDGRLGTEVERLPGYQGIAW
jgi:GDP-mannose 6-dehydrogenase